MKLHGKTILVTGGAGFIGSHFVEKIAPKNNVIVYDNFSSSVFSLSDLRHLSTLSNLGVVRGDILNLPKLKNAMCGVDIVFHFAVACVRLSLSKETYVHEVNATGTLNTLVAARDAGVKRFVYISSSEVYGTTLGKTITESHPIIPQTVYGMSKYMGELYTKHFNDIEKLPSIIIRPFNTYGPREHMNGVYGEVIPRFVVQAINGKQPTIFGSGKQTRDFTYITDTVEGIKRAAECDELVGDVINIAHGKEVTVNTIAQAICDDIGLPFHPTPFAPRPNDVDRLAADIVKAKKMLSYAPSVNIRNGLNRYIAWIKTQHPNPKTLLKLVPATNW